MKFKHFARALAPMVGIALAAATAGCNGAKFQINDEDGKKLSELDLGGTPPDELVLAGPDRVEVTAGDTLAITVDGDPDAVAEMRFTLKDGTLGVMREGKIFEGARAKIAVVHVTMPAPKELVIAGSGSIRADALARDAKVNIAGSGQIETPYVAGESLDLNIGGSGTYRASGSVRSLKVVVAGSGSAALDTLRTEKATVTIAGSGDTAFTSDGDVKATIMGSGEVRVKGRARCTVSSMGSGRLVCETPVREGDENDSAATPQPPETPEAP